MELARIIIDDAKNEYNFHAVYDVPIKNDKDFLAFIGEIESIVRKRQDNFYQVLEGYLQKFNISHEELATASKCSIDFVNGIMNGTSDASYSKNDIMIGVLSIINKREAENSISDV